MVQMTSLHPTSVAEILSDRPMGRIRETLPAIYLETGLDAGTLTVPNVRYTDGYGHCLPCAGVWELPAPLDRFLVYQHGGVLGLRYVQKWRPWEAEIVLPEEILLGPREDLVRAFFARCNAFLRSPLAVREPEPANHRALVTWDVGSEDGLEKDLAAVVRQVGRSHGLDFPDGNAFIWVLSGFEDTPAHLVLEGSELGLHGSYTAIGVELKAELFETLRELEPAILSRNRPSGFLRKQIFGHPDVRDHLADYRGRGFAKMAIRLVIVISSNLECCPSAFDDAARVEALKRLSIALANRS
ncbi:MAG TPA: hypothetical protein VMM15_33470 [Bradyrhizobium sp.]|nr:hypothetical protein [Bradyrhizobium sp.]